MTSTPTQTPTSDPTNSTVAPLSAAQVPNPLPGFKTANSLPAGVSGRSPNTTATKRTIPPNAFESSNMSSAVGAPPPADASSPVNGKNPTIPAVPSFGGPTIVNGNSVDHTRRPSFTVTPSGVAGYTANGGAVGGIQSKTNIQFGSITAGSPAPSNIALLANQPQSSLGVTPNPRIASPQNSPSPIPQPAASGGRPPSGLQGPSNAVNFGQFSGDANDPNVRQHQLFDYQAANRACSVLYDRYLKIS